MYTYPGESFLDIVDHYISSVELHYVTISDADIFAVNSISIETDYYAAELSKKYYERGLDYLLTFKYGPVAYDIRIAGTFWDSISILRLSMFLYLTANENCIPGFNHTCPFWFYNPYNLEAVVSILSEDVSKGYYDVLNGYISYMDKFGMEIDDIIEACHKFGHNELLMEIMRMLGTAEKEPIKLRL
jgi:hypothetical protein